MSIPLQIILGLGVSCGIWYLAYKFSRDKILTQEEIDKEREDLWNETLQKWHSWYNKNR